ncbi:MAG: hypothetical protein Q8K29_08395 [Polaromonas sp.]|nr:hypothetical protein [Polaromonas sp.]
MNRKLETQIQTAMQRIPCFLVAKDATGTYVDWPPAGGPLEMKPESVWSVSDPLPAPVNEVEVLEKRVRVAGEVVCAHEAELLPLEAAYVEARAQLDSHRGIVRQVQERRTAAEQAGSSGTELRLLEAELGDAFELQAQLDEAVQGVEARLQVTRDLLRRAERECQEAEYLLRQARARVGGAK